MTRPRALMLSVGRNKLELRHRRILRALAWAYPGPMTTDELIGAVWDLTPEPDCAKAVLRCAIHDLRRAGWMITTRWRVGYTLSRASFDLLTLPVNPTKERAR